MAFLPGIFPLLLRKVAKHVGIYTIFFVNTEPMLEYMLRVSLFLSEQNMNCLVTGSTKKTSLATENDHSVSLSLWLESTLPESSRFYFYHSTINPFSYSPKYFLNLSF